ncbi:MAG: dynamin family protein [Bacteroidales bacterium]|nr:dynamin family protein [Bacteroidales bacterium]MCM1146629.1 dynamin family protein [Bacteroidales bacterium]MCM1206021.1 dynamin family protein [Bacillota bacterium]MCM1511078.1 dynamin family protein [Clostridium sp.]
MIERAKIQSILDNLRNCSRIESTFYDELDKSFDAQTLNIGVVGKMNAGKSSLVNAAIFGDEILPSGTAPVTVTLTEVSYGLKDEAIVEYMSEQDVEDLKLKAQYQGEDLILAEKARAAKDVLSSLSADFENYLGKTTEPISLSDLRKYVDAKGEMSGLAKSVKITLNNENLKGVTIIDTPGFNDPITSRGETTKKALQKCHVLLFVHNKDGYDSTDVALLTEQVDYAGISEIVDILNKVDLLQDDISKWPKELDYFIQKRSNIRIEKESIKQLLANSHAVYTSSLMALCGLIPYKKMTEDLKYQYGGFEEDFELLGKISDREQQQKSFVEYSNIESVVKEINRLAKEGSIYLVNGPLMTLHGKLTSVVKFILSEINSKQAKINSLNVGIEANRKNLESFEEFMTSVMKKVSNSTLEMDLTDLINKSIKQLQSFRASEAAREFTEKRYPEPGTFTTGVTKANIANYNTFSSGFENSVRDILNNLKDAFVNSCKKEINALLLGLANTSLIDKEHTENLKASLINSFIKIINEINVIVPSHRISELPSGNQKQWDKLRAKFLNSYDDEKICNLKEGQFAPFKQTVDSLGYVNIAIQELDRLRNEILDSLNKSPFEKQKKVKELSEAIEALNDELSVINGHIKSIDELKENL